MTGKRRVAVLLYLVTFIGIGIYTVSQSFKDVDIVAEILVGNLVGYMMMIFFTFMALVIYWGIMGKFLLLEILK